MKSICLLVVNIVLISCSVEHEGSDGKESISKEDLQIFSEVLSKLIKDLREEVKDNPSSYERCKERILRNADETSGVILVKPDDVDEISMTSLLYEEAETWSPCRRSCITSRIRKCRLKSICSVDVLVEEAFCYTKGTKCEAVVKQRVEELEAKRSNTNREEEYSVEVEEEEEEEEGEVEEEEEVGEGEEKDVYYYFLNLGGGERDVGMNDKDNDQYDDYDQKETSRGKKSKKKDKKKKKKKKKPKGKKKNKDKKPKPDEYYYYTSMYGDDYAENYYQPDEDIIIWDANLDDLFGLTDYTFDYNNYGEDTVEDESETSFPDIDTNVSSIVPTECGQSPISAPSTLFRIIGGREAIKDSWPWQVAILNRFKEVFCGGTLISSRWVLTAAHCVKKTLYVRVGEHDIRVPDGETELKVAKSFINPNFDLDTIDSDIALLQLPKDVIQTPPKRLRRACLPQYGAKLPLKQSCVVLGWGKERESHIFGSDVLRYVKVPIVSNQACEKAYRQHGITSNMFCAGVLKGGADACEGDSGGPILCRDSSQRWVLQGVTSFGEGCGEKKRLGVYVKVSNYIHWINETISSN